MSADVDRAIVGSGCAGSLLAMIARRLGLSVILIEKAKHPRFAIGESSTPLANLILEELATRYDLPRLLPLTKWGTWQKCYPEIACGLKRGFSFFAHSPGRGFEHDPQRLRQCLVAASPHSAVADTHWFRADVDQFFMHEAQAHGVEYMDETVLERFSPGVGGSALEGMRRGRRIRVRAQFVIDASGPRGFLHRALHLDELPFPGLPATEALFAHFTDVRRLDDGLVPAHEEEPPFSVDDAAVHHVFEGGWIWVLRVGHGVTSAGVAARGDVARALQFADGAPAWNRLLKRLPGVRDQFAGARAVQPFVHAPRLPFRSARITGKGWALLPSAAGFVDPLLSTGFPLTLLGVERLAEALTHRKDPQKFAACLTSYAAETTRELAAAGRLIAALYACMDDFETFAALLRLYFAAATFGETARRLGRPHLAGGFMMHDHPRFGRDAAQLCRRVLRGLPARERTQFRNEILCAIEPFDLIGLGDTRRRNWFPCVADDLFKSADKLGATHAEIERLLARSGFAVDANLRSF